MKIQLLVIFGGKSVEHEISIISAIQAIHHIDRTKYDVIPVYVSKDLALYTGEEIALIEAYRDLPGLLKRSKQVVLVKEGDRTYLTSHPLSKGLKKIKRPIDVAFPIVHGYHVEDGTMQGYLSMLGLPYIGCDVISSAAGMDKHIMKAILRESGIPVLDARVYTRAEYESDHARVLADIGAHFPFPMIVKPATLGSSIGITKASSAKELEDALETAFSFAAKVLVERAITSLREINCSVIGDTEEAEASECEEPMRTENILSYEDKYIGGGQKGAKSEGMATLARQIPADISPAMRTQVRELAVKTFCTLGCNGVSRIDFLYDTEGEALYVNEINTIPGSLSFYLWEPLGISYTRLIDRLVELSLKRVREENTLLSSFDTNVLALAGTGIGGSKNKLKA